MGQSKPQPSALSRAEVNPEQYGALDTLPTTMSQIRSLNHNAIMIFRCRVHPDRRVLLHQKSQAVRLIVISGTAATLAVMKKQLMKDKTKTNPDGNIYTIQT